MCSLWWIIDLIQVTSLCKLIGTPKWEEWNQVAVSVEARGTNTSTPTLEKNSVQGSLNNLNITKTNAQPFNTFSKMCYMEEFNQLLVTVNKILLIFFLNFELFRIITFHNCNCKTLIKLCFPCWAALLIHAAHHVLQPTVQVTFFI